MKRSIGYAISGVILWFASLALFFSLGWRAGVAWILGSFAFNISEYLRRPTNTIEYAEKSQAERTEGIYRAVMSEIRKQAARQYGDPSRWRDLN